MQIKVLGMPRSRSLERGAAELSREAQQRLAWFDYYQAHGRKAALTRRYFGISRQTFYRWKRCYDPDDLKSWEDASHRPHRRRQPTWTPRRVERALALRRQYPRGGKDKLVVLLGREGRRVSTSLVGRILRYLKKRGLLIEPILRRALGRRASHVITASNRPATWWKWTRWTCGPCRAWCSSRSRRATWSRAGT